MKILYEAPEIEVVKFTLDVHALTESSGDTFESITEDKNKPTDDPFGW